jgi:hypothetical protein
MNLLVTTSGELRCVYGETINLTVLGKVAIARGSHVEPTANGEWTADLSPVDGPLLGPFTNRSDALEVEAEWLDANWLTAPAR